MDILEEIQFLPFFKAKKNYFGLKRVFSKLPVFQSMYYLLIEEK